MLFTRYVQEESRASGNSGVFTNRLGLGVGVTANFDMYIAGRYFGFRRPNEQRIFCYQRYGYCQSGAQRPNFIPCKSGLFSGIRNYSNALAAACSYNRRHIFVDFASGAFIERLSYGTTRNDAAASGQHPPAFRFRSPAFQFRSPATRRIAPFFASVHVFAGCDRVPDRGRRKDPFPHVKAVIKSGHGQPSHPSDRQLAKPQFVKAWLDLRACENLTVKAGQTARFDVKVGGEPFPEVLWYRGDEPIQLGTDVAVETKKDISSVLVLRSCKRSDGDDYKILVRNKMGEQAGTCHLTVLDKPTPPEGPLEVTNVYEDRCDLSWKPPVDDGGQPVDHYEIEKLDTATGKCVAVGPSNDTNFHVDGLKKGQKYLFRVKAVNNEGASDPLQTEKGTLAKNSYDEEPGKPGKPVATDWDVDRVELEWDLPANDGGVPITGYVIEKKSKQSKEWTKAVEIKEPVNKGLVTGLKANESKYQFRIRAINKADPDEASEPSDRIVAKARNLKPHIDCDAMKTIAIKVGQNFEFNNVPVKGEPPPEMVWSVKGQKLETANNVKIANEDYLTRFSFKNAQRKDTGKYVLMATNINGKDEHGVDVIVIGKPAPPGGPLEVKDVYEEHMTLEWNPPDDDGGVPIDYYEVEKMEMATGTSFVAQNLHAIILFLVPGTDNKAIVPNLTESEFRVIAVNEGGPSEPSDPSNAVVCKPQNLKPKIERMAPLKIKAGQSINFDVSVLGEPPPSCTWSFEGEELRPFGRIKIDNVDYNTKIQIKNAARSDSGQYKLKAENENGTDEAAVEVIVVGKPTAPEGPLEATDAHATDMTLQWKPPVDDGWSPIDHYVLGKFDATVSRWMPGGKTADGNQTELQVEGLAEGHEYKFRVKAFNRYGESDLLETARSIVAKNHEPTKPGTPEVVDWDKNYAHLEWTPPMSDGGTPIEKYVIEIKGKHGDWGFATEVPADQTTGTVTGLSEGNADRTKIDSADYNTKLKTVDEQRMDSGKYTIVATNCNGRDEADVTVTVLCTPGAPRGPLDVSDVYKEGCTLRWREPEDNGGSDIWKYVVEKQEDAGCADEQRHFRLRIAFAERFEIHVGFVCHDPFWNDQAEVSFCFSI